METCTEKIKGDKALLTKKNPVVRIQAVLINAFWDVQEIWHFYTIWYCFKSTFYDTKALHNQLSSYSLIKSLLVFSEFNKPFHILAHFNIDSDLKSTL